MRQFVLEVKMAPVQVCNQKYILYKKSKINCEYMNIFSIGTVDATFRRNAGRNEKNKNVHELFSSQKSMKLLHSDTFDC